MKPIHSIPVKFLVVILFLGFTGCLRAQTNECELVVLITKNRLSLNHYIKTNGLVYSFGSFVNHTNQVEAEAVAEIYRDVTDFFLLKTNKHKLIKKYQEMNLGPLLMDDLQTHSPKVTLIINGKSGNTRELMWVPYDRARRKKYFQFIEEETVFPPMLTALVQTIARAV